VKINLAKEFYCADSEKLLSEAMDYFKIVVTQAFLRKLMLDDTSFYISRLNGKKDIVSLLKCDKDSVTCISPDNIIFLVYTFDIKSINFMRETPVLYVKKVHIYVEKTF